MEKPFLTRAEIVQRSQYFIEIARIKSKSYLITKTTLQWILNLCLRLCPVLSMSLFTTCQYKEGEVKGKGNILHFI